MGYQKMIEQKEKQEPQLSDKKQNPNSPITSQTDINFNPSGPMTSEDIQKMQDDIMKLRAESKNLKQKLKYETESRKNW